MVLPLSTMRNFPSPWRVNFAGQVVRDEDVEETLRKVSAPERKSVVGSSSHAVDENAHRAKNEGKQQRSWFQIGGKWKKATKNKAKEDMPTSYQPVELERGPSDEFDDRSDTESFAESYVGDDEATIETFETKDTKGTYFTKRTIATLTTMQYEEFVRQEEQEDGWNAFFCGIGLCQGNYGVDDECTVASIATGTKPFNQKPSIIGTTYDINSRRTQSVVSDYSNSSEDFGSDDGEYTVTSNHTL